MTSYFDVTLLSRHITVVFLPFEIDQRILYKNNLPFF